MDVWVPPPEILLLIGMGSGAGTGVFLSPSVVLIMLGCRTTDEALPHGVYLDQPAAFGRLLDVQTLRPHPRQFGYASGLTCPSGWAYCMDFKPVCCCGAKGMRHRVARGIRAHFTSRDY